MKRERWFPAGSTKKTYDDVNAVIATYNKNGAMFAIGYGGKRSKPDFHYRFRTPAERDAHINKYLKNLRDIADYKAERKKARVLTKNPVNVGDLFVSTWGYDQTNVDFFKVTKVLKKSVYVVRIGGTSVPGSDGMMCDKVVADPDTVLSDPELKRLTTYDNGKTVYISLGRNRSARPVGATDEIYRSWYA